MVAHDLQLIVVDLSSQVAALNQVIADAKASHKRGNDAIEYDRLIELKNLLSMKRRQRGDLLRAVDMKRKQERHASFHDDLSVKQESSSAKEVARIERAITVERCFVDVAKVVLPEGVFVSLLNMAMEKANILSIDSELLSTTQ